MALTRSFKETVLARVHRDAAFAQALLDEAATLFLNGEPETARLILRDLVNATIGFEQLSTLTAKPSPRSNPSRVPASQSTGPQARSGNWRRLQGPTGARGLMERTRLRCAQRARD